MTDDFEDALRETLAGVVPAAPTVPGRAAAARRCARRARHTKAALTVGAAVAVTAAIVVIPSVLASPAHLAAQQGSGTHSTSNQPGMPVAHPFACARGVVIHNESSLRVVPPGAVLARICPADIGTVDWSAPSEPLVTGVGALIREVDSLPIESMSSCATTLTDWPAFTLTFQYADGHTVSVEGRTGPCGTVGDTRWGGTAVMQDYLSALYDQRADYSPPPPSQSTHLECPSDPRRLQSVLVDGRGPGLTRASECVYGFPGGSPLEVSVGLSPNQVTMIDADLAAHARRQPASTPKVRQCQLMRGPASVISIVGVDAWGDRVELSGSCSVYRFMDRNGFWYWTPTPRTAAMLDLAPVRLALPGAS